MNQVSRLAQVLQRVETTMQLQAEDMRKEMDTHDQQLQRAVTMAAKASTAQVPENKVRENQVSATMRPCGEG